MVTSPTFKVVVFGFSEILHFYFDKDGAAEVFFGDIEQRFPVRHLREAVSQLYGKNLGEQAQVHQIQASQVHKGITSVALIETDN